MEFQPSVIGVYHSIKHPDYPSVIKYIESAIQKDERIAVESPWNLERIEHEGKEHHDSNYRFLYELCAALRKQHACIVPVEDEELYRFSGQLKQWYMYDEPEVLEADERWHELSIKRSIRHVQLAYQHECGKLRNL